ncbi:hypothetical protein QFZ20_004682 [Flavobacterium sp. W4I14]|nr:hypothetical protein [Flavobacterium sp. W4I14]
MNENQSNRRGFLKAGLTFSAATLVAPRMVLADVPAEEEGF